MSSMVEIHSLPCPGCGDRITIAATVQQFVAYMSRDQFVQNVFPELDDDTRERFISGVCPTCWEEMYPEDFEDTFLDFAAALDGDLLDMADDDTYDSDWYVD